MLIDIDSLDWILNIPKIRPHPNLGITRSRCRSRFDLPQPMAVLQKTTPATSVQMMQIMVACHERKCYDSAIEHVPLGSEFADLRG